MKTNIGIETTDEERALLSKAWGSKNRLVSRQEIKDFVNAKIQLAILGEEVNSAPSAEIEADNLRRSEAVGDRSVRDFVPSRGDEPYLYRPQDPELAARCSAVLDGLEFIEQYAWDTLERNRA